MFFTTNKLDAAICWEQQHIVVGPRSRENSRGVSVNDIFFTAEANHAKPDNEVVPTRESVVRQRESEHTNTTIGQLSTTPTIDLPSLFPSADETA